MNKGIIQSTSFLLAMALVIWKVGCCNSFGAENSTLPHQFGDLLLRQFEAARGVEALFLLHQVLLRVELGLVHGCGRPIQQQLRLSLAVLHVGAEVSEEFLQSRPILLQWTRKV